MIIKGRRPTIDHTKSVVLNEVKNLSLNNRTPQRPVRFAQARLLDPSRCSG